MQYLEKDKYSETLVEKLCVRFSNSKSKANKIIHIILILTF